MGSSRRIRAPGIGGNTLGKYTELNNDAAALYSKGDIDAFVDTYADNAVLRSPDGAFEGKAAILEYWTNEKAAFPDSNVEMVRSVEQGDMVAGEWTWSATNTGALSMPDGTEIPATGKHVEVNGAEVLRFDGDKVVEHILYFDNLGAFTQLGLIPS
jgi:predicted ester cyclase